MRNVVGLAFAVILASVAAVMLSGCGNMDARAQIGHKAGSPKDTLVVTYMQEVNWRPNPNVRWYTSGLVCDYVTGEWRTTLDRVTYYGETGVLGTRYMVMNDETVVFSVASGEWQNTRVIHGR